MFNKDWTFPVQVWCICGGVSFAIGGFYSRQEALKCAKEELKNKPIGAYCKKRTRPYNICLYGKY